MCVAPCPTSLSLVRAHNLYSHLKTFPLPHVLSMLFLLQHHYRQVDFLNTTFP